MKLVIGREPLQARGFPWRATELATVVIWPVRISCYGVVEWRILQMWSFPLAPSADSSRMSNEMVGSVCFKAVDSIPDGVPWLQA